MKANKQLESSEESKGGVILGKVYQKVLLLGSYKYIFYNSDLPDLLVAGCQFAESGRFVVESVRNSGISDFSKLY
jgi:hypothetical protein